MSCYFPMNVRYYLEEETGKKRLFWSRQDTYDFYRSDKLPQGDNFMQLPCSACLGCRLERAAQWAIRCVHEAQLYEDNCFVTLTFNPKAYSKMCPYGSLDKRHVQLFMKRLRKRYSGRKIRVFYSGEYGPARGRAHYHLVLFNFDFKDKVYWKTVNGNPYYLSQELQSIWSDVDTGETNGFAVLGALSYESAGYVARYSLKKVNGKAKRDAYEKIHPDTGEITTVIPEFCQASLRPGIGKEWFDKYGLTDIFPRDECVVKNFLRRPPRYYDKLLERSNPDMYKLVKDRRVLKLLSFSEEERKWKRLQVKFRKKEIEIAKLIRIIDSGS